MSHKKKRGAPVPAANRPHVGPAADTGPSQNEKPETGTEGFQQQDPKRRLGNYEGAGEHAFQQPGGNADRNG